jgi:hypothetical protein
MISVLNTDGVVEVMLNNLLEKCGESGMRSSDRRHMTAQQCSQLNLTVLDSFKLLTSNVINEVFISLHWSCWMCR